MMLATGRITRTLLSLLLLATLVPSGGITAASAQDGGAPPPALPTERLSGPDRFATAAAVSSASFATADTVYIAPGGTFPQALAGGPRAAQDDAPLLLVDGERIPQPTIAELDRLDPDSIVILGSTADVPTAVAEALAGYGQVRRIAGADDISTVAEIALDGWQDGADVVYLATSQDFPDALAGGVAGALRDGPVLLVDPTGVPHVTAAAIQQIAPTSVVLLGGTAAISDDVVIDLLPITAATTRRLAGPTRIETAIEVSTDTHHDGLAIDAVYLATAGNFPDALATASAIAATGGALLLTHRDCVPYLVRNEIARLAPQRLVILGGTAAVSQDAANLTLCETLPPAPQITVEEAPPTGHLPELEGSGPRPIAQLVNDDGDVTPFVEDEIIVTTDDQAALEGLLEQTGGTVITTVPAFSDLPTTHVVEVDPVVAAAALEDSSFSQVGGTASLGDSLQWLNAVATGPHTVTSQTGYVTLGAVTFAATAGLSVGLNYVSSFHGLIDRDITESLTTGNNDPFAWNQFRHDLQPTIGTAEAWRLLAVAGRDTATATIGIIDGGFAASNGDYPPGITGNDGSQNPLGCGPGNPCPWHGTDVTVAAAGVIDNSFGSAGAAGPIGRVRQYRHTGGVDSMIARIQQAVADGVDVINMSFGGEVDAVGTVFVDEGEDATEAAYNAGVFVVASAGNDGRDVDAQDCFGACWEEEWVWPCENDGVYCVGGLASGSNQRDPGSNHGSESCGSANCQVDIFAPFTVFVGADGANTADQLRSVSGTSVSAPNVAGIAALAIAAAPSLPSPLGLEALLDHTAEGSPDPTVGRIVDADGLISLLLADAPPFVEITSPVDGSEHYYGGIIGPEVEATTATIGGGQATVSWEIVRLNTNQTTSVNPTLPLDLPAPSDYLVRATATIDGVSATDEVTITAVNVGPAAEITTPADGEAVIQGQLTTVNGTSIDPNQPLGLPCSAFDWAIEGQMVASGCSPTVAFNQTGPQTLTLTVTDAHGLTDSHSVTVMVQAPPETGPPTVNITAPADGNALPGSQFTQLQAVADDPDGDALTYEWTVSGAFGAEVIGSTLSTSWRPDDDVPFNCGGQAVTLQLTATAVDGSTSDQVDVYITQPPC